MIFYFGGVNRKGSFGRQQPAAQIDITLRPRHPAADAVVFSDDAATEAALTINTTETKYHPDRLGIRLVMSTSGVMVSEYIANTISGKSN